MANETNENRAIIEQLERKRERQATSLATTDRQLKIMRELNLHQPSKTDPKAK